MSKQSVDPGASSAAGQSDFRWRPMQDSTKEIRVLKLLPGSGDQVIKCQLIHTTLEEAKGHYEALSYCWGEPVYNETFIVDGAIFKSTTSLHGALRALRLPGKVRFLWTDAVCINQQAFLERSDQVRRMHLIYSSAVRCLIWLGESAGSDPFRCLRTWAERLMTLRTDDSLTWLRIGEGINWPEIEFLFSRPWFFRRWVVQEAALSQDVLMVCGSFVCAWAPIRAIYEASRHFSEPPDTISVITGYLSGGWESRAWKGLNNALTITACQSNQSAASLSDALFQAVDFDCTDPRDEVYALLNLVSSSASHDDGQEKILSIHRLKRQFPNYSLTVDQVNQITTRFFLENEGLHWLSWVSGSSPSCSAKPSQVHIRPSWVIYKFNRESDRPDLDHVCGQEWRTCRAGTPPGLPQLFGMFLRDRSVPLCLAPRPFAFNDSGNLLNLRASFVGQITVINAARHSVSHDLSFAQWARDCEVTVNQHFGASPRVVREFFKTMFCTENVEPTAASLSELIKCTIKDGTVNDTSTIAAKGRFAIDRCLNFASHRRLCIISNGFFGLVPRIAQVGDLIVAALGVNVPLVLRPCESGLHYKLIGEAYVRGLMNGEAWMQTSSQPGHEEQPIEGEAYSFGGWGRSIDIC